MSRSGGERNREKFIAWRDEGRRSGDWQDYIRGSSLNRARIAREIACNEKAFRGDNPGLTEMVDELEKELIAEGVIEVKMGSGDSLRIKQERKKVSKKDSELKVLREQNATLKARIEQLEEMLGQYGLMEKYLQETGRWVRP